LGVHFTGYGQQTATWLPRIAGLGHEVTAVAPPSVTGAALTWNGITVLPGYRDGVGNDILLDHYRRRDAQVLITLCDVYMLAPDMLTEMNVAHWVPVDCYPVNYRDMASISASGALPLAMSRFGERQLKKAGLSPRYVPHGIDITVFSPPADHRQQRDGIGLSADTFVIGINAFNKDVMRKGFPEQFLAFAQLHERHPDSVLLVHSAVADPQATDLQALARACGIEKAVLFPDQYAYACGMMTPENMAAWYGALDVLSNCSYGEGFGLATLEAQACGTPVVVTDASASPELCGSGVTVPGTKFWVPAHRGWWLRPDTADIAAAYENMWVTREEGRMPGMRAAARQFALTYDADAVLADYWEPVLKEIESGLRESAAH
jgi:glycosyltransferase involved in cell wall biosynthesis